MNKINKNNQQEWVSKIREDGKKMVENVKDWFINKATLEQQNEFIESHKSLIRDKDSLVGFDVHPFSNTDLERDLKMFQSWKRTSVEKRRKKFMNSVKNGCGGSFED